MVVNTNTGGCYSPHFPPIGSKPLVRREGGVRGADSIRYRELVRVLGERGIW
jgi:hypothetical protein